MARLRVLFADDQIPDEAIPDDRLTATLAKKYPGEASRKFVAGFLPMRQAVKKLREGGYDVTTANTHGSALDSIKTKHFDIAIVDLRWDGDRMAPARLGEDAGWTICDAIEDADKRTPRRPTFQIVCSSRFDTEAKLAFLAGQRKKLPIFKSYTEAGSESLLATVNYIDNCLAGPSAPDSVVLRTVEVWLETVRDQMHEVLSRERQWTLATLSLVVLSVLLILAGASIAVFGKNSAIVGSVTALSSAITSTISGLLFSGLKMAQENTKKCLDNAQENFQAAMNKLATVAPGTPGG